MYRHNEPFYMILFNDWMKLDIEKGDNLYVFGKFNADCNTLILPGKEQKPFHEMAFIILCPEEKVGTTNLTSKSDCLRSTTISKFMEQQSDYGAPAIEGRILHNLFESVIKHKEYSLMESHIKKYMKEHISGWDLEILYCLGIDFAKLERDAYDMCVKTWDWRKKFIGRNKEPVHDGCSTGYKINILEVEDTERRLESDKLGLVGIIDVVVKCEVYCYETKKSYIYSCPFELKTGYREQVYYYGQVDLYRAMMYLEEMH